MDASTAPAADPIMSRSSQRLLNKVAIVTGASSGLGRAIAIAYAAEGAKVVCTDLEPLAKTPAQEGDKRATHEVIVGTGGQSIFAKCDVSKSQKVQDLVAKSVEQYGRLDIMVNNAGIAVESTSTGFHPIHKPADSTFDTTIRVNARSVFLGCKYAGIQMLKQSPHSSSGDRGWIINTASVAGLVGLGGAVSYGASKGAVVNMTRTIALDYAPHRIYCNALCPGFTNTPMMNHLRGLEGVMERLAASHPFRGLGEPEDIARAAVFLASEDASWILGVPLPVDGGYTAR